MYKENALPGVQQQLLQREESTLKNSFFDEFCPDIRIYTMH